MFARLKLFLPTIIFSFSRLPFTRFGYKYNRETSSESSNKIHSQKNETLKRDFVTHSDGFVPLWDKNLETGA